MTVSTAYSGPQISACDGSTTSFPVAFQYADKSGLLIELVDDATGIAVTLTEGTDYTRSGDGMAAPSSITTLIAYPAGKSIRRSRATPREQTLLAPSNSLPPAALMERAWDRAVLALQEVDAHLANAFGMLLRTWLVPQDGSQDGKYPVVLPGGALGFASGTGTDGALRVDMASDFGAGLMRYNPGIDYPAGTIGSAMRPKVSVTDYGAKGDAVPVYSGHVYQGCTGTDDTAAFATAAAIALAKGAALIIPPRRYRLDGGFVSPAAELAIEGFGAQVLGPGRNSGVDAFTFANMRQGDDDLLPTLQGRQLQELPSVLGFRSPVTVRNASWLNIETDLVQQCMYMSRTIVDADIGGLGVNRRFCVQNRIAIRTMAYDCIHGHYKSIDAMSDQGIQGCEYMTKYAAGCGNFIENYYWSSNPSVAAPSTCDDFFNSYICPIVDGNGGSAPYKRVIEGNLVLDTALNFAFFEHEPINMTDPATSYLGIGTGQLVIKAGRFEGDDVDPYKWRNFLPGGARATIKPGFSTLYIYVNQAVAVSGNGSAASPYKTFDEAFNQLLETDGFGNAAVIKASAGTYTSAITLDQTSRLGANWNVQIQGVDNTPASVVLSGGVSFIGGKVTLQDVTIANASLNFKKGCFGVLNRVNFGAVAGAQLYIDAQSYVEQASGYSISGGASVHVQTAYGGRYLPLGKPITLVGTPAFSSYFALAGTQSLQDWAGCTFSGSATGIRYGVTGLALINTNGGGANFLPGSSAGAVSSGGQYT